MCVFGGLLSNFISCHLRISCILHGHHCVIILYLFDKVCDGWRGCSSCNYSDSKFSERIQIFAFNICYTGSAKFPYSSLNIMLVIKDQYWCFKINLTSLFKNKARKPLVQDWNVWLQTAFCSLQCMRYLMPVKKNFPGFQLRNQFTVVCCKLLCQYTCVWKERLLWVQAALAFRIK